MKILIKNGRMLNPSDKTDEIGDLYIEDGVIKEKDLLWILPVSRIK